MSEVSVIGTGLMGSAIARTFVAAGLDVTVWNRTRSRAEEITGASVADTPAAAIAASPLSVVVVASSNDVRSVLSEALAQGVAGDRTILNLTSGSVTDARALSELVEAAGLSYLDGAITVYPRQIGLAETGLYIAGPDALWATHQEMIRLLGGRTSLLSTSIEGANVVDLAVNGVLFTVLMTGFFEAAAYAHANGVSVSAFVERALDLLPLVPGEMNLAASQFEAGDFDTDQAAIDIYESGARMVRSDILRSGLPGEAHHAYLRLLNQAQERGLGGKALAAALVPLVDSAKPGVPA